jgi:hypothetical protein
MASESKGHEEKSRRNEIRYILERLKLFVVSDDTGVDHKAGDMIALGEFVDRFVDFSGGQDVSSITPVHILATAIPNINPHIRVVQNKEVLENGSKRVLDVIVDCQWKKAPSNRIQPVCEPGSKLSAGSEGSQGSLGSVGGGGGGGGGSSDALKTMSAKERRECESRLFLKNTTDDDVMGLSLETRDIDALKTMFRVIPPETGNRSNKLVFGFVNSPVASGVFSCVKENAPGYIAFCPATVNIHVKEAVGTAGERFGPVFKPLEEVRDAMKEFAAKGSDGAAADKASSKNPRKRTRRGMDAFVTPRASAAISATPFRMPDRPKGVGEAKRDPLDEDSAMDVDSIQGVSNWMQVEHMGYVYKLLDDIKLKDHQTFRWVITNSGESFFEVTQLKEHRDEDMVAILDTSEEVSNRERVERVSIFSFRIQPFHGKPSMTFSLTGREQQTYSVPKLSMVKFLKACKTCAAHYLSLTFQIRSKGRHRQTLVRLKPAFGSLGEACTVLASPIVDKDDFNSILPLKNGAIKGGFKDEDMVFFTAESLEKALSRVSSHFLLTVMRRESSSKTRLLVSFVVGSGPEAPLVQVAVPSIDTKFAADTFRQQLPASFKPS